MPQPQCKQIPDRQHAALFGVETRELMAVTGDARDTNYYTEGGEKGTREERVLFKCNLETYNINM